MKNKNIREPLSDKVAEGIDRFLGVFSPKIEAKRRYFRMVNKLALSGSYEGAKRTRLNNGWSPQAGSADEDLLTDLPMLRNRSRDLERNNDIASGLLSSMKSNVIGCGLIPQSMITSFSKKLGLSEEKLEEVQDILESNYDIWSPFADASGRMSMWELQNLAFSQRFINGESISIRLMLDEPGRPYNLAIQIIESDRLATPSDKRSDRSVRDGVELGSRGQPVAYWICKTHPGDFTYNRRTPEAKEYVRYPAADPFGNPNVLHDYWVKRPGQTRGVPFLAPVLNKFESLNGYFEAELVANRLAACIGFFIETPNAYDTAFGRKSDTVNGKFIEDMEPGMINYLNPGEAIKSFNPQRPGGTFDSFVEKTIRFIGAGSNVPYEIMLKDFSKTNFSSARAAILEAIKFFRCEQKFAGKRFCQPIWGWIVDEQFLRGQISAERYFDFRNEYTNAKWIPPGWGYVDPEKEINASKDAVDNNISTLADECAAHGKDWEDVLRQRSREEKLREKLGLPETPKNNREQPINQQDKPEDTDEPKD